MFRDLTLKLNLECRSLEIWINVRNLSCPQYRGLAYGMTKDMQNEQPL